MSRIGAIIRRVYGRQLGKTEQKEKRKVEWAVRMRKLREVVTNRRALTVGVAILTVLFVLFVVAEAIFQYNLLCSWQVVTDARRADVDRELQRRKNLIPNLVLAVENYAVHEQLVFKHVSDARDTMKTLKNMDQLGTAAVAGGDLSKTLSRLIALAEQYPLLKATQSIQDLMKEAAETENRIADAKKEYNRVSEIYNQYRTVFPGNVFAFIYRFPPVDYLDTEESLDVPQVAMKSGANVYAADQALRTGNAGNTEQDVQTAAEELRKEKDK